MQPADMEFFEAYKRLDKLCSEMYQCQNGVSAYIEQMESQMSLGESRVPSWRPHYKMLKHVRWVRNQIAHESDEYQISEPGDLIFVRDYYNRIASGQDALTQLRKIAGDKASRPAQQGRPSNSHPHSHSSHRPYAKNRNQRHTRRRIRWGLKMLLWLGIAALLYLGYHFATDLWLGLA